jgi:hypothetical protein
MEIPPPSCSAKIANEHVFIHVVIRFGGERIGRCVLDIWLRNPHYFILLFQNG